MNRIIPLALSLVMGIMGCIGAGKPAQSSAQAAYISETTSLTARTTASTSTITTTAAATTTASDTTTSKAKKTEKAETTTKPAKASTTKAETTKAAETTTVKATEPETKPETTQQKKREKQSGSFAWPADSDAIITAGYPYYSSGAYHGGVDIALYGGSGNITENTYIYAAQDGVVVTAYNDGNWNTGFGNYCIIDHGNGVQTLYAHSNDIQVSEGDTVKRGQVIGLVGDTGNTTAPHLHFEVRVETSDGCYERTNPLKFISEP